MQFAGTDQYGGVIGGKTGACTCTCRPGYSGPGWVTGDPCYVGTNPNEFVGPEKYCINNGTVVCNAGNCSCDCAPGYYGLVAK